MHFNLAEAAKMRGDYEIVIRHLHINNVYAMQAYEDSHAQLGKAYYAVGRYNEAIEVYESWFRMMRAQFGDRFPAFHDFDSGDLYILLAQAYLAVKDYGKAMDAVESAVRYYLDRFDPVTKSFCSDMPETAEPLLGKQEWNDGVLTRDAVKARLTEKLDDIALAALRQTDRFHALKVQVNLL